MKTLFALTLILVCAAFLVGCGGGEKAEAEKPAAEGQAAAPSATGEYMATTVTDGGTISGRVTYAGEVPPRQKLEVTKDVNVCGKVEHYKEDLIVSSDKGIANVVVKITNISQGKDISTMGESFELDQQGCQFVPHVVMVPVDAELMILNSDGILHNIHTFSSENEPFNKAQPPYLKRMKQTFSKPEIVQVKCDVHAWMSGYIVVAEHPYYAITDENGNFELTDVPAGTYTLEYWQETLGKQTKEVTVTAGGTADGSLEYTAASAALDADESLASLK